MARPFIVLGDRTDHGGEVVSASATSDTHGKRIARVGDQVTCPKRRHGPTTIVTGDPTMIIDGKAVARHGDKCACGATLIASQYVSFVNEGSSVAAAQGASASAFAAASSERPPLFDFDEQVELLTNTAFAEGLPYLIKVGSRTVRGRVGADGRLPRVDTAQEDRYTVYVGDEALAMMDGGQ